MGSIPTEGLEHKGRHLIRWVLNVAPTEKEGVISLSIDGMTVKTLKVEASTHPVYIETSHIMDVQAYPTIGINSGKIKATVLTQFKELDVSDERIAKPAPVTIVVSKPAPSAKKTFRRPRAVNVFKPVQAAEEEEKDNLDMPILARTVSHRNGRAYPIGARNLNRSNALGADQLANFVKMRRSTPQ